MNAARPRRDIFGIVLGIVFLPLLVCIIAIVPIAVISEFLDFTKNADWGCFALGAAIGGLVGYILGHKSGSEGC